MKKGISLIVLVITIIVMIIIAGAIIISLNSSNVINQANDAVANSNTANARSIVALKYAEILAEHYAENPTTKFVPNSTEEYATTALADINAALDAVSDKDYDYEVVATATGYTLKLNGVVVATNS